jgi:hypothetical protein
MTTHSRTCSSCGAIILEGTTYCGKCGTDVDFNAPIIAPPTTTTNRPKEVSNKDRNNRRIIIGAISALLLFSFCCVGVTTFSQSQSKKLVDTELLNMELDVARFTKAISKGDTITAISYCSSYSKITLDDLNKLVASDKRDLFTRSKGLSLANLRPLPLMPISRQVVSACMFLFYDDGTKAYFYVVMRMEHGHWQLESMDFIQMQKTEWKTTDGLSN